VYMCNSVDKSSGRLDLFVNAGSMSASYGLNLVVDNFGNALYFQALDSQSEIYSLVKIDLKTKVVKVTTIMAPVGQELMLITGSNF